MFGTRLERGRRISPAALLPYLLLPAALLIGGGAGPLADLAIELAGIGLLVLVLATPAGARRRDVACAYLAVALIAAVPLIQLVPLPAALWGALPERGLATQIRGALGLGDGAFPLSLDPDATWRSALLLPPAFAMFLATLRADAGERRRLIVVALACILLGTVLGGLQVLLGSAFYPFPTRHLGNAIGFMVNRNHQASLLLVGIALLPSLLGLRAGERAGSAGAAGARLSDLTVRAMLAAVMVLLALAVILTTSRAGMALLPLAVIVTGARLIPGARPRLPVVAAVAALALVGAVGLVESNGVVHAIASRFGNASQDERAVYWRDTWFAAKAYWPAGSGLGTFVPVFATVERLDTVTPNYVNHAHDDYLELLLETGILLVPALIATIVAAISALRISLAPELAHFRTSALLAIATILLHSVVDYPLRTLSLATMFGFLAALLFDPASRRPSETGRDDPY